MPAWRKTQWLEMSVEVFGVRDGFVADESLSADGSRVSIGRMLVMRERGTYCSGSKPGMLMSSLRKLVGPLCVESARRSDDV